MIGEDSFNRSNKNKSHKISRDKPKKNCPSCAGKMPAAVGTLVASSERAVFALVLPVTVLQPHVLPRVARTELTHGRVSSNC